MLQDHVSRSIGIAEQGSSVLKTTLGVMLRECLAAWIELRGVANVRQRQPACASCQELAEHQRVVVIRGAVVGDDHLCAHRSTISRKLAVRGIGLLARNRRPGLSI